MLGIFCYTRIFHNPNGYVDKTCIPLLRCPPPPPHVEDSNWPPLGAPLGQVDGILEYLCLAQLNLPCYQTEI